MASSYFNFSTLEATGVVGILADEETTLIGLVSLVAPVIAGGNTCVVLSSEKFPLCAVTFAEVIHSSDVDAGVVNILTGMRNELAIPMSEHMDVNAVAYSGKDLELFQKIGEASVSNLKRVHHYDCEWSEKEAQSLHHISDFQEVKTTWHPIEDIGGATSNY